jgi:hypothetical protein
VPMDLPTQASHIHTQVYMSSRLLQNTHTGEWAGGSHSSWHEFQFAIEPGLAPCGWRCPNRRLTLTRPFGNGLVDKRSIGDVW